MKYFLFALCILSATIDKAQENNTDTVIGGKIYSYVEQMPSPPFVLNEYLSSNLKYPQSAIDKNIEGRVILKFVVYEDGHIADVTIVRGIDEACDKEAVRVVSSMPAWRPARQNGKHVKVYYNLPIVFKLDDPEPPANDKK